MAEPNGIAPTIVIFGASGDLAQRKLIPALYELHRKQRIAQGARVVGFSRTPYTHEAFRAHLQKGVREFTSDYDEATWTDFAANIYYSGGQPDAKEDFEKLKALLKEIEGDQPAGRMYYMATPPTLFKSIVQNLGHCGMNVEGDAWRRLIIEKPFGHDLASALDLNQCLHSVFRERQIYRIDHYLGKETVQNVTVFRFANAIFEPIWNRNYIDNVQISVLEDVAVGRRGGYYEKAGVFRDMFQNHLLQLLTLIAMEPPAALNADSLRNEKVKVLAAIKPPQYDQLAGCVVHAQYRSYRDEEGVDRKSRTPTFAALKLYVNNWRWQGVPFYLRSGKSLAEKRTRIAVQFKSPPHLLFDQNGPGELSPNILAMEIQPQEGIHLSFQAKVPAVGIEMQQVDFDFQYAEAFKGGAIPEAYERLLLDALQGDAALFTRSDEIELSWGLIDPILEGLKLPGAPSLEFYEEDTFGPKEANDLLGRDGFKWVM